ncbi:MAG: helix-turn-helix domain-containing protein [Cetobacterium sp.]
MNKLGIVLKKLRESRGLTVMELAAKSGTGNGTIGNIERGANKSTPKTLEKLCVALELTKEERDELFSCLIPDDIGQKITKREKLQKEEFMNQAQMMFNDESISEEDKEKMLATLQEAFYMAKIMNKKNK